MERNPRTYRERPRRAVLDGALGVPALGSRDNVGQCIASYTKSVTIARLSSSSAVNGTCCLFIRTRSAPLVVAVTDS